jgi:hypothetical protein
MPPKFKLYAQKWRLPSDFTFSALCFSWLKGFPPILNVLCKHSSFVMLLLPTSKCGRQQGLKWTVLCKSK